MPTKPQRRRRGGCSEPGHIHLAKVRDLRAIRYVVFIEKGRIRKQKFLGLGKQQNMNLLKFVIEGERLRVRVVEMGGEVSKK